MTDSLENTARRPLTGVRVLDMSRLAPGPYCTMLLADLGAEVIAVGGGRAGLPVSSFSRGKHFIALDLKSEDGKNALRKLADTADVFVESFRPGVADRLGAGYAELSARNPGLIYCSLTGYGQAGPMSQVAGHDLNYLAMTGILGAIGPAEKPPTAPLNIIADFAGGSLFATIGILAALYERSVSGKGQHIDAAMIDGCLSLMAMHYSVWNTDVMPKRGTGWLAGSVPYYCCYQCRDGRFVSVGALEPQFFAALWADIGNGPVPDQMDMAAWPHIETTFANAFLAHDRDEWGARYSKKDFCVLPVLDPAEVWQDPHIRARFPDASPTNIPAAPSFSRTPIAPCATDYTDHTDAILSEAGLAQDEIDRASPTSERQRMNADGWPPVLKT